MAEGILIGMGLLEDDLLKARDAAFEAFVQGKATTGFQVHAGNGVGRAQLGQLLNQWNPKDTLREIKYALYRINPTKYADCKPRPNVTYGKINSWA